MTSNAGPLLIPGTRVGVYEVQAFLARGGMGEVYRARDTRLGRDVALKLLPADLTADPDRLARFEREARVLASLNHAHIGAIYGFEERDAASGSGPPVRALVLEFVDGETLAERIARGPIPVPDALPMARQIADALDAAHERGVVHRDLKPANIKITPDGTVKVLDFGLAKAAAGERDAPDGPTISLDQTRSGVIMGTPAYMSPEQARGLPVDRRTDIWAFGCVLFEMLSGRSALGGATLSETLVSVLEREPDWTLLPAAVPEGLRRLLRRCLTKNVKQRLRDAGDLAAELDAPHGSAAHVVVAGPLAAAQRSWMKFLVPALAGAALAAGAAAAIWPARQASPTAVSRLAILPPPGEAIYPDSANLAISPDGRMVAFVVGSVARTESDLWIRSLDTMESRRVEGGEYAFLPFWSPDSRRVGFFTPDKLKAVTVSTGRVEVIGDAPGGRGGTWNAANEIVFAPGAGGPLKRVSGNGGEAREATRLDAGRKESSHRFPWFLPDGDHFLYAVLPGKAGKFDVFVGSLRDGSRKALGPMESAPVYVEPGWLLHARQGVLAAQPFDAQTLSLTGEAVPLDDEPSTLRDPAISYTASHSASVAADGSAAYYSAPSGRTRAAWLDATGRETGGVALPPAYYSGVRISPNGRDAVVVRSTSPTLSSLWLVDLERGVTTPLSSGPGLNDSPVWSPDGSRVVFASDRDGPQNLFLKDMTVGAPERPFYSSDVLFKSPDGWSSDGQWILFRQLDADAQLNIWMIPASGQGAPSKVVARPLRNLFAWPSPDNKWLAHLSEPDGRLELFVQSFPKPGRAIQVSRDGALWSWWSADGRRLMFVNGDQRELWAANVAPGAVVDVGAPARLGALPENIVWMDAMPDRTRFLALVPERSGVGTLTVVHHRIAALAR